MSRREKIKQWIVEHQEAVVATGVLASVVGAIVLLVRADAKATAKRAEQHEKWVGELNDLLELERAEGRVMSPLDDRTQVA